MKKVFILAGLILILADTSAAIAQDMSFIESKAGFDKTKNARVQVVEIDFSANLY